MKIAIPAGTKLTISSGTKQLAPDDFSPLQLPNLLAWYDASDSGTIDDSTDSGRVEQWSDKSGNNYHLTQTTLADKPYTGRTINGLPAVDFRAAQELERTDTFGVTGNPALTICFICELDSTTGRIITMDGAASASIGLQADASWRHNDGSNIFTTPPTGETLIFTARRRSGDTYADSEMRYKRADAGFDSVSSGSSTPNLTGTNTHLGSGNATGYLDGAIGEIIVYNSYLSDDDVATIYTSGHVADGIESLGLGYTADQIEALADLYRDQGEILTINGENWKYYSGTLPGDDGSKVLGESWTHNGYKYIKLGSGVGTFPEPTTMLMFLFGGLGAAVMRRFKR